MTWPRTLPWHNHSLSVKYKHYHYILVLPVVHDYRNIIPTTAIIICAFIYKIKYYVFHVYNITTRVRYVKSSNIRFFGQRLECGRYNMNLRMLFCFLQKFEFFFPFFKHQVLQPSRNNITHTHIYLYIHTYWHYAYILGYTFHWLPPKIFQLYIDIIYGLSMILT